jgi:hypothetical protein
MRIWRSEARISGAEPRISGGEVRVSAPEARISGGELREARISSRAQAEVAQVVGGAGTSCGGGTGGGVRG